MRIYIESTIASYIVARPARNLLQAAHQEITKKWWHSERHNHQLFISPVVLAEIADGELAMAEARLELLQNIQLLAVSEKVEEFAKKCLSSGILPPNALTDATHIALAAQHRMDILLSWNCRHIANGSIQVRLRRLAAAEGIILPLLCTPQEIPNEKYGDV